jgi:hypothetical protein
VSLVFLLESSSPSSVAAILSTFTQSFFIPSAQTHPFSPTSFTNRKDLGESKRFSFVLESVFLPVGFPCTSVSNSCYKKLYIHFRFWISSKETNVVLFLLQPCAPRTAASHMASALMSACSLPPSSSSIVCPLNRSSKFAWPTAPPYLPYAPRLSEAKIKSGFFVRRVFLIRQENFIHP